MIHNMKGCSVLRYSNLITMKEGDCVWHDVMLSLRQEECLGACTPTKQTIGHYDSVPEHYADMSLS